MDLAGWLAVYDPDAKLRLFAEALAARQCRRVVLMPSLHDCRQLLEEALRMAGMTDAQVSAPYKSPLLSHSLTSNKFAL